MGTKFEVMILYRSREIKHGVVDSIGTALLQVRTESYIYLDVVRRYIVSPPEGTCLSQCARRGT